MKKQWISVKCGLSRDPKHRQTMGESIWLFLHILDIVSWEDGIAHDWKDEAAAEDMGMPVRTLREHRRKLDEQGYITCIQKQYTQDIVIHNWTNPREYNGQTYNEKQSYTKTSPKEDSQGDTQGYIQGYIQGDTQGSTQGVTPTYSSNNQIPNTNTTATAAVEFSEIATYWENEYTMLTPAIADWLNDIYDTYPPRWVMDALAEGVNNNVRKKVYVDRILKDWQANGRKEKPERKQYQSQNKTASGADALEQYAKEIGAIV